MRIRILFGGLEHVLAHAADRADIVLGQILEFGAGGNAVVRIADSRVIDIPAYGTNHLSIFVTPLFLCSAGSSGGAKYSHAVFLALEAKVFQTPLENSEQITIMEETLDRFPSISIENAKRNMRSQKFKGEEKSEF